MSDRVNHSRATRVMRRPLTPGKRVALALLAASLPWGAAVGNGSAATMPDADDDRLQDTLDLRPAEDSNACDVSGNFLVFEVPGNEYAQCSVEDRTTVPSWLHIAPDGIAEIYSPNVTFQPEFSVPRGARLSVFAQVGNRIPVCEHLDEDGIGRAAPSPPPLETANYATEPAFPDLSLQSPLALATAPGDDTHLYVASQDGGIYTFAADADVTTAEAEVFLDLTDRTRANGEQGLLGFTFDPDYASNGYVYVNYSANASPDVATGDSVIARFVANPAMRTADAGTETELLRFPQPATNHNGGSLAFGPDGMLYIASGDGGGANDPGDNAQNLGNLLGTILRIRPDGTVPEDNPFVGMPEARDEVWAYGLRNPFRMSFDFPTGRLWLGDVGQGAQEEIDIVQGCGNYGWPIYEGTRSNKNPDEIPASAFQGPLHTYPREQGRSVTGGLVYRGTDHPELVGRYLYGDFITGRLWLLTESGGDVTQNVEIGNVPKPSSFGTGLDGEPLITSFNGGIYRLVQGSGAAVEPP